MGSLQREGQGVFVPEWDKRLPIDREETDMIHGQMTFYKEKVENLLLG